MSMAGHGIPGRLRIGPVIEAVDAHAAGEPGRVIVGGVEGIPGGSMFEAMTWLQANRDDLRLRMLREPRGYPVSCCNLILPSADPEADAGYVIMEQVEYPGMSGSNTICVVTVLLETGRLPMTEPMTELTLESPAGLIRVSAECRDGKVRGVTFRNVPAFATHLDAEVEVPQLGTVTVPRCGTSTGAARCVAKAGTFRNVTAVTFPSRHAARTRIRPAGASSVSSVTGSVMGRIPVSSRTVTTHIVFVPDIPGYSTCSMIT
jgi:hypothetical protein